MSTLSKRQSPLDDTGTSYDNYDNYGYDPSTCYQDHTCSWWWSSVSLISSSSSQPHQHPFPPSPCLPHDSQHRKPTNPSLSKQTGSAVRYTIVSILFFLLIAYFFGGYLHARARLRKNLPPLSYHRWMVKRHNPNHQSHPRYYYNPHGHPMYNQNPYYGNGQQQQHPDMIGMQGGVHAPPPPAYNAGDAPPPVYQPPMGGSKVAADQSFGNGSGRVGESSAEVRAPDAVAGRGV